MSTAAPTTPNHAVLRDSAWACPTCGADAVSAFCPSCGERRPSPHGLSARRLVGELTEQITSLDTKLVRTVALLFARPGALLVEYRRGARARYTTPFQLFIWVNVAFFVIVPALSIFDYRWRAARDFRGLGAGWWGNLVRARLHAAGSPEALRVAFNASVGGRMQTLFGVIVPVMALLLLVLYPRRRPLEHLLMATYLAPAFMAALVGAFAGPRVIGLLGIGTRGGGQQVLVTAFLLGVVLFGTHVALALRRAYDDTWAAAVVRGALVAAGAATFPSFYYLLVTDATLILL